MLSNEIKPIPDWDGYFISSAGVVYSRWINKGIHGMHKGPLKALKGRKARSGHISVQFKRGFKSCLVHRLVYELFVGPIPRGMVIRHLNDIPDDNRLENLAIGTQKDNMQDCIRNGNHKTNRKIPRESFAEIKYLRKTKTVKELAEMYNVNEKTIRNVLNDYYKKAVG